MSNQDKVYSNKHEVVGNFKFDDTVANVFEDMISRSVPGYQEIISFINTITQHFQQDNSQYYDLGCSLGAGMLAMGQSLSAKNATIVGVDNSSAMLAKAQKAIETATKNNTQSKQNSVINYDFINNDLQDVAIENAAMVIMNFTLQFIPLKHRQDIITKIYDGLHDGGVLLLSEKVQFDDPVIQTVLTDLHHQYKSDQGYSKLEISQKRDAIENVLIPEKLDTHSERLRNANFTVVTPWFQNFQFFSIIAIK